MKNLKNKLPQSRYFSPYQSKIEDNKKNSFLIQNKKCEQIKIAKSLEKNEESKNR